MTEFPDTRDSLLVRVKDSSNRAAWDQFALIYRPVICRIAVRRGLQDADAQDLAQQVLMTRSGVIAGTPQYMSPEQARGERIDATSDLFSLGSVMYTMCTGRPPFRAETSYGILRRITDNEPRPIRAINPDVPEWLCAIIAKLLAKRPADRFASAVEVAELLEDCLAHVQQPTTVPLPDGCLSVRERSTPDQRLGASRRFFLCQRPGG